MSDEKEILTIPEEGFRKEISAFGDLDQNNDDDAKSEDKEILAETLEKAKEEAERAKIVRDVQKEGVKHTILLVAMGFLFLLACVTLGVYAFHILSPEHRHWLSAQQISKIETTFIGGIVGTMLQGLKRYV